MQLVCRFLVEFIRDREAKELPLRSISQVEIGQYHRGNWKDYWLPIVEVGRDPAKVPDVIRGLAAEAPKEGGPLPVTVSQLVPYLRLSYCVSVCIDLRWDRCLDSKHRGAARGAIFGDLVVSHTFVGELTVCVDKASVFDAHYAFEAFKPLSKVLVKVDDYEGWSDWFHERFFISSAECGVRSIKFQSPRHSIIGMGVVPALSFAFTEPTTGGDRSIGNVVVADCYDDMLERAHDPSGYKFFAQLVEKAGELDGGRHIDFKFTIHQLPDLDALPGFKKYQKDDRSWLVNDLENGVTLEVVMGQLSVEVDVFSSSFDRDGYVNNKLESLRISWVDAGIRQPFPSKQFGEPTKTDMLLLKVFMIITKLIPLSTKSLYCKMYSFVNTKQWRRIEVVNWSDE
ncbi:hypothetical protein AAVH_17277 [Aphelenchoides avenae]|nr:hypothetical protein AAVH_17277 [Aphelenchus avenae]